MIKFKNTAIVMGGNPTALGVVRELGRRGVHVICIDSIRNPIARYSKYCTYYDCPSFVYDHKRVLDFILKITGKLKAYPVLFPTNDYHIQFISRYRDILKSNCLLTTQNPQLATTLSNKIKLFKLAHKYKVRVPSTITILKTEDYEGQKHLFTFPCIIKPNVSSLYNMDRGAKAIQVNSQNELDDNLSKIKNKSKIVIQELIPGPDQLQYSSVVYIDKKGRIKAQFVTQKRRSYPVGFGVGGFVESCHFNQLNKISVRFLKQVGYTGIAEVEFKIDERTKLPYLIEVNTRTWAQNYLSDVCGIPFSFIAYCDASGMDIEFDTSYKPRIACVSLERDIISTFHYLRAGDLSLFEYILSLFRVRAIDMFSIDDMIPFFYYLFKLRIIKPELFILKKVTTIFRSKK